MGLSQGSGTIFRDIMNQQMHGGGRLPEENKRKYAYWLRPSKVKLVHMLYVRRFNQTECAKVLGITQGAVAQRHAYIKNFIKKFLVT